MKKLILITTLVLLSLGCGGQSNRVAEFGSGTIKISVEQGGGWLHDFPLFWFIKKKNAPQIAIWLEDLEGNFISTIYVSEKLAKQTWTAAGGNRRKESLPYWSFAQGKQYNDGLYLPTKNDPLPDAVTGATPKGSFATNTQIDENLKHFVIKAEFNHSVDFNKFYPKDAKEGDSNYSGGKWGSGQPAIVYQVMVDLMTGQKDFKGVLIGHSSPDGSDGTLYFDTSQLSTALDIVKNVTIYINE